MPSKHSAAIHKWCQQYLAQHPLRAKSIVMTLFGDAITPHGGQAWLGSMIELLAPFDINDRLVRTSVFRLAEEGWLNAQREGRRSLYSLDTKFSRRLEQAYQRVYSPSYREWDGTWTLVFSTNNAITTQQRSQLRKELQWQGFAMIAPTVFAHPAHDADTLDEMLERTGMKGRVFVCTATSSDLPTSRPLNALVNECWELDIIIENYQQFISAFSPLIKMLDKITSLDPQQSFILRTLLIHHFRRAQLHDPQLPLALLPKKWQGKIAYELCHDIYQATFQNAERYILEVLRKEDPVTPEAAPYFFHRFGGLVSS